MSRSRSLLSFGLPALVLGLLLGWYAVGGSQVQAQNNPPGKSGPLEGSTLAFTTGALGSEQRLFLIDTKKQVFAIYKVDVKGLIRLESARNYQADMELSEFNNAEPKVATIRESVGLRAKAGPN